MRSDIDDFDADRQKRRLSWLGGQTTLRAVRSELLNANYLDSVMRWYMRATALLYLAGSVFIMTLDLIGYSLMKDVLLVCFLIGAPLSVISTACIYLRRRKGCEVLGLWFALVFLIGNLSVSFAYFFLPTGMESVWDPIGGFWGVNSMVFSLLVALPMSIVDFFSKQARLRGVVGVAFSLVSLPIVQAITQWIVTYKQLSFK